MDKSWLVSGGWDRPRRHRANTNASRGRGYETVADLRKRFRPGTETVSGDRWKKPVSDGAHPLHRGRACTPHVAALDSPSSS